MVRDWIRSRRDNHDVHHVEVRDGTRTVESHAGVRQRMRKHSMHSNLQDKLVSEKGKVRKMYGI